ncbi:MAG TPA: hypothetical protein VNQ90_05215 [Chthoniobacteraceae bacterium]|nr:hypothetical protein [Chthoniobacteraceae bacterium]
MASLPLSTSRRLLATLIMAGPTFGLLAMGWGFLDSYRSQRAWEKHRAAAVARGVEYDFTRFAPAPVPDEKNFAATPFFRELLSADEAAQKEMAERLKLHPADEATTLPSDRLKAVRRYDALLDEISRAAKRPAAVFPLRYDQLGLLSLPHALPLIRLAQLYQFRSKALLANGLPEEAAADLLTLFRLAKHGGAHDPIVIMNLVETTLFSYAMEIYWEGLISRQWPDATLLQVQARLQDFDFLLNGQKAYQGARADYVSQVELILRSPSEAKIKAQPLYDEAYQKIARAKPFKGWVYQNLMHGDHLFEKHLIASLDPAARRVAPKEEKIIQRWFERATRTSDASRLLAASVSIPLQGSARRFAYAQTVADLGVVATALERYHRRGNSYPETLAALVPTFLEALPHDLVTGEPLHYRRTENGRFLLYSVGWNGTDDGGRTFFSKQKRRFFTLPKGDWIWPLPDESSEL